MRIRLADEERGQRRRLKGKGRNGHRSRTYETAIALPKTPSGTRKEPGRAGPARGAQRQRQVARRRTPTRRSRPRASQPEATTLPPAARRISWRAVLARVPVALILVGLVGGITYVSTDARFFVYEAQIVGVRHLEAEAIYQTAGVHEQNIFWVQPQAVARRIIEMEGVQAVHVRCSLPAQVAIEVEEREPVVMWRTLAQERDWWLDKEGVVLPYHGDVRSPDTIFVVDSSQRHLEVGAVIEPEGIVRSVQQLAAALPEIKVFLYDADRGLSFVQRMDGGEWPVYVGRSEDLPRKIQVVQVLTDYLVTRNIRPRYVDVRWAEHPVYGKPGSE